MLLLTHSATVSNNYILIFCRFKSVKVKHCLDSYAVAFEGPGWGKFLYSGDCRPSSDLAAVGKAWGGVDVLLHEATFEDELAVEAKAKKHSTVKEAMTIGKEVSVRGVKRTCLRDVFNASFARRRPGRNTRCSHTSVRGTPASPLWRGMGKAA